VAIKWHVKIINGVMAKSSANGESERKYGENNISWRRNMKSNISNENNIIGENTWRK
jgi:hypothetical protein